MTSAALTGARDRATREASVATLDAFSQTAWDSAAARAGARAPMQQYIWTASAAEALSPGRPITVYYTGPREAPRALAPFSEHGRAFPRRRLLGAEELGEPVEVITADESDAAALASALARDERALGFGHYPIDGAWANALRAAFRGRGRVVLRPLAMRAAPRIALDETWRNPETRLSSRRRSDLRRMRRKAEKLGEMSIDFLAPGANDAPGVMAEAAAVESQSWKGRAGTALAQDARLARFFDFYAPRAAAAGALRIAFLRINGEAAAMQIAVETNGGYWLLKIGYNEKFAACSPGNLLMCASIARAARENLDTFEFLGKEAPWTTLWTDAARPIAALRAYPYSPSGLAAAFADGGAMAQKALHKLYAERLPKQARREDGDA